MQATVMYRAGDVRVEERPDPRIEQPTDAILRVVRSCICGSDLWPYRGLPETPAGQPIGHEAIGVVDAVGSAVENLRPGDFVVMPFAISDGTCAICREGLTTGCVNGGFFGTLPGTGAQAEAVRVPFADGTLYKLPVGEESDERLLASLLTLSDVMGTGHHAAAVADVGPGKSVAVVGDGAVGLCAVLAAKRLGAERIILLGHHADRVELGREFGATDVVAERGEEAVERVRELTGGLGVHAVLECVGTDEAVRTSIELARPGGTVGRVGVPQHTALPGGDVSFYRNVRIAGGPAPTRAYLPELLPDVLEGRIEPGRVFDCTLPLDETPAGYRAMAERQAIKVLLRP